MESINQHRLPYAITPTHYDVRLRPDIPAAAFSGSVTIAATANEAVDTIVLNSIDRDGMMQGYDLDLARKVRAAITTPMTVVGGAGSADDLRALTEELGPIGAGAGSLFVFKGKYRAVLISYARP